MKATTSGDHNDVFASLSFNSHVKSVQKYAHHYSVYYRCNERCCFLSIESFMISCEGEIIRWNLSRLLSESDLAFLIQTSSFLRTRKLEMEKLVHK